MATVIVVLLPVAAFATGSTPVVTATPSVNALTGGDTIVGTPKQKMGPTKPHTLPSTAAISVNVDFVNPGTRLLSIDGKTAMHKIGGPVQSVFLYQFDEDTHFWRGDIITAQFVDGTPMVYASSNGHWSNIVLMPATVNDEPVATVNYKTESGTGSFKIGFRNQRGNAEPFYMKGAALPGDYVGTSSVKLDKAPMPAGTGLSWSLTKPDGASGAGANAFYFSDGPMVSVNEGGMLGVLQSGIDNHGEPYALFSRIAGGLCIDRVGFESDGRGGTRPVFGGVAFGGGPTPLSFRKC